MRVNEFTKKLALQFTELQGNWRHKVLESETRHLSNSLVQVGAQAGTRTLAHAARACRIPASPSQQCRLVGVLNCLRFFRDKTTHTHTHTQTHAHHVLYKARRKLASCLGHHVERFMKMKRIVPRPLRAVPDKLQHAPGALPWKPTRVWAGKG